MRGMYNRIFLDSAMFMSRLSDEAKKFLEEYPVCVSNTFISEVFNYDAFLPVIDSEEKSAYLKSNFLFFHDLAKRGKAEIYSKDYADIWTMIRQSVNLYGSICVMTGDKLLISRIRYADDLPNVDIWDLNTDTIISGSSDEDEYIVSIEPESTQKIPEFSQGDSLICGSGYEPVLGEKAADAGRSGFVWDDRYNRSNIIKIYREYPDKKKVDHLKELAEYKDIIPDWCLLPQQIVYKGYAAVGFMMKRSDVKLLDEDELFWGDNELQKDPSVLKRRLSYTVELCLQLLMQIKYLNATAHICVFDFLRKNFSEFVPGKPITFFDTDSFLSRKLYFSRSLSDVCFSRGYNVASFEDLIQISYESAFKLVFELFSLGYYPFYDEYEGFCFEDECVGFMFSYKKLFFPKLVYISLEDVFTGTRIPSLNMLIHSLSKTREYLRSHPDKDLEYSQIINSVLSRQNVLISPSEIPAIPGEKIVTEKTGNNGPLINKQKNQNIPVKKNEPDIASTVRKNEYKKPVKIETKDVNNRVPKKRKDVRKPKKKFNFFGKLIIFVFLIILVFLVYCLVHVGLNTNWTTTNLFDYLGDVFTYIGTIFSGEAFKNF